VQTRTATRWLDAARAVGEGDWREAADVFERIGSLPDEALARLHAATDLEAAELTSEADDERRRASAFYRQVRGAAYVGEPST
jgi:hypothetical protein